MSFMDSFNFRFTINGRPGMINPLGLLIAMVILLVVAIAITGDESADTVAVVVIWGMFALMAFIFIFFIVMVVRQMRTAKKDDDVQTDMSYTLDEVDEKK